jgi:hypothetical protein
LFRKTLGHGIRSQNTVLRSIHNFVFLTDFDNLSLQIIITITLEK